MSNTESIAYTKFKRPKVYDRNRKPRRDVGKDGDYWRDHSVFPAAAYVKAGGAWKPATFELATPMTASVAVLPRITFDGAGLVFSWELDEESRKAVEAFTEHVRGEASDAEKKHRGRVLTGAYEAHAIDSWVMHELDYRMSRYGEQYGRPAEDAYRADKWDFSGRPKTAATEWREKAEAEENRADRAEALLKNAAEVGARDAVQRDQFGEQLIALREERAQVGRELEAALERIRQLDDQVATLTGERDKARGDHDASQTTVADLWQKWRASEDQAKTWQERALKAEGAAETSTNALVNVSKALGQAEDALNRVLAQAEQKGAA